MTAKEMQAALIEEGICSSPDEAAHFLVDCGEINSTEHEALLSPAERKRVYA